MYVHKPHFSSLPIRLSMLHLAGIKSNILQCSTCSRVCLTGGSLTISQIINNDPVIKYIAAYMDFAMQSYVEKITSNIMSNVSDTLGSSPRKRIG